MVVIVGVDVFSGVVFGVPVVVVAVESKHLPNQP